MIICVGSVRPRPLRSLFAAYLPISTLSSARDGRRRCPASNGMFLGPKYQAGGANLGCSHQTSPIVKLGDLFHFTNSHPYEAILGAIDASWGVLSRKNFRRWLKKILGKKNDPGSRVLGYPPFFLRNFIFSAQLELQPSKAPKRPPNPPRARFHCCSSALATVFQLPQPVDPHMPIFLRKNIFSARLVFEPSRTAKKAAKRTRVGFRSCGSALATLLPPSTPDRAAGSEVPGSAGALVRFGAHSPPTRRRSCFMPRGTARARLTTDAAILPTLQPLPSMLPERTRMGDTVPISFSVVSGEPSD